jgi:formylglycine-generating enzyme required for sulfatase activity
MPFKVSFAAAACAVAIGLAFPAFGQGAGSTFRDCPQCPEMVVVPSGRFLMGAAPGEEAREE